MQAEEALLALERLHNGTYPRWEEAHGPDECTHGIAKGLNCRPCDRDKVAAALSKPSVSPEQAEETGK